MTTQSKMPTHRVYAVTRKEGQDKGFWTEIGAAWQHSSARGFNVRLNFMPTDPTADIVILEREEKAPA